MLSTQQKNIPYMKYTKINMKSLKHYIIESLNTSKNVEDIQLKAEEYINANYTVSGKLSFENVNGVCIVNCDGDVEVKNKEIKRLTNGFK